MKVKNVKNGIVREWYKTATYALAITAAGMMTTACSDDDLLSDNSASSSDGTSPITVITNQSVLDRYVTNVGRSRSHTLSRSSSDVIDTTFPSVTYTSMPSVSIDWDNLPSTQLNNFGYDAYKAAADAGGAVVGNDSFYTNYGDLTIYVPAGKTFTLNQLMDPSSWGSYTTGTITVYVQEGATFKTSSYATPGGGKVVVYNWGNTDLSSWGTISGDVTIYNAQKVTATSATLTLTGGAKFYAFGGMQIANVYPGVNDNSTGSLLYVAGDLDVTGTYKQQTGCDVVVMGDLNTPAPEIQGGATYVKGSVNATGLVNIGGGKMVVLGNISGSQLNLQGASWTATPTYANLYVGGYADFNDGSNKDCKLSYANLVVVEGLEVYNLEVTVSSYVDTGCNFYVENKLTCTAGATIVVTYVEANTIVFSSGAVMSMTDGGYINSKLFELNNADTHSITSSGYGFIYTDHLVSNYLDINVFTNIYVTSPLWNYGSWDLSDYFDNVTTSANESYKETYFNTAKVSTNVKAGSVCAEYEFIPPVEDVPYELPDIDPLDPIAYVDRTHKHPISSTCIAVSGNTAYLSWHLRGGNVWGCIEKLSINRDSEGDYVTLDAYMETPPYLAYDNELTSDLPYYRGVSQKEINDINNADQSQSRDNAYDFNHIVLDGNYLIAVGDHDRKGGFVGRINVGSLIEGTNVDCFEPRQMGQEKDGELIAGGSGNSVVVKNDELWMTSRGGFVKYPYTDGGSSFMSVTQKMISAYATQGSAKHIAVSSTGAIATIELNAYEHSDWWDDNETKLDATIRIWPNGFNFVEIPQAIHVDAFAPIYGKDVLQWDEEGNLWSCQGKNGVRKYSSSGAELGHVNVWEWMETNWDRINFKGGDETVAYLAMKDSAANGLCVDSKYLFIANGGAGVWVYDKNDLTTPVTYYFTPRGETSYYDVDDYIGASANYVATMDANGQTYLLCAYGRAGMIVFNISSLY